jgi:catechol-2,3-dioxygenase
VSAAASRSCAPQCSFYFADPDGNTLEIYHELPHALELFPEGRA